MSKEALSKIFGEIFQGVPRFFKAPGRINLIGEHTDYNEGYVLPAGIDKYCSIAISPAAGKISTVMAMDLSEKFSFHLVPGQPTSSHWINYIWGVMKAMQKRGLHIPPFEAVIQSDVPVGAGLSSSAALEVVFARAFNDIFNFNLTEIEITRIAKEAENNFVGLQCGIMDMFASVHAKKNHAIKLDCRSLDFEYVPLNLGSNKIVLFDTSIKHELASSEYNLRRLECEAAVKKINAAGINATALRDVSIEQVNAAESILSAQEFKRAKYVVEENDRLNNFIKAIQINDFAQAGNLLYATHQGLKDDYQVSCEALDFLVDFTKSLDAVWGGRMMGGGFGGCTINLVQESAIEEVVQLVTSAYFKKFGLNPKYYIASTGDGACEF
ncbi:MAG: galactokinase [Chitinophagaceae bacterium]